MVPPTKSLPFMSHFRSDFLASVVVFLVALPLCIGIAVAVGVSPARALLTGIIGGIVVGFFAKFIVDVTTGALMGGGPVESTIRLLHRFLQDQRHKASHWNKPQRV